MKLTPISDTNFYGPEKRMAAERERNRRFWDGKAYTPQGMRVANSTTDPDEAWVLSRRPPGRTASTTAASPARSGSEACFCMNGGGSGD